MGVRTVGDYERAVMICSTTDWAFGPVFDEHAGHDALERIEAFCQWLHPVDPRSLSDGELTDKYNQWRAQEATQWKEKEEEYEAEV